MPDWFEALNRDFRYQLTVLGGPQQAWVAEEMKAGQFLIQTSEPNTRVSWQVTGIRHDRWAEENRIPVEEPKPAWARGKSSQGGKVQADSRNAGQASQASQIRKLQEQLARQQEQMMQMQQALEQLQANQQQLLGRWQETEPAANTREAAQ